MTKAHRRTSDVAHSNFAASSRLNGGMVSLMVFAPRGAVLGPNAFAASVLLKVGAQR